MVMTLMDWAGPSSALQVVHYSLVVSLLSDKAGNLNYVVTLPGHDGLDSAQKEAFHFFDVAVGATDKGAETVPGGSGSDLAEGVAACCV